jgi:hypothetical protein
MSSQKYPQDLVVTALLRKLGGEAVIKLPELTPDELGRQAMFLGGIPGLKIVYGEGFVAITLEKSPEDTDLNFIKE